VQDLLWVLYPPYNVNSPSVHSLRVSVSRFSFLKFETPTFISSTSQHPDLNPMNSKICSSWSTSLSVKFIMWTDRHLSHGFEQRIINRTTVECAFMSLDEFLSIQIWLNIITWTFEHVSLILLCQIYRNFKIFDFYIFTRQCNNIIRYGGKHENFLLNPIVKKFWKSANVWQSYERIISWAFLLSRRVTHCCRAYFEQLSLFVVFMVTSPWLMAPIRCILYLVGNV